MTPEDFRQHHVDALVMQLAEAAAVATSVYTAAHITDVNDPPSLGEVLEYADWSWRLFVTDPLAALREDIDVEPTDLDDVRSHLRMLTRRRHLEAIDTMAKILADKDIDDLDNPDGGYL